VFGYIRKIFRRIKVQKLQRPFHHEKTPSCIYYEDDDIFYCYTCMREWKSKDIIGGDENVKDYLE
jgi:hypothetical protein